MGKYKIPLLVLVILGLLLVTYCVYNNNGKKIVVTTSLNDRPVLVGDIPCRFPLVKEPTVMNIMITGYDDYSADDVFVWQKYEEMTGVDVNWNTVVRGKRSEAVATALMNQADLDLILRCKISSDKLIQYGESGLVMDLAANDLLKNYAPNCWAYLQSHPDALAAITNPDGTIYALPQINSGAELRVSRKIFINKTWLDNVNMTLPTTTEEYYKLLTAFKEQDANGNGDPTDEIPLASQDWSSLQEAFYGSFGLANRGVHNQIVDYDEKTGGVRLIPASDEYRDFLKYFNRLYSEKLLDDNIFTTDVNQWTTQIGNDKIGSFVNTNLATLPADKTANWVAVDEALEGPFGDKLWTAIRANFHSTGAAVIPSTCNDPKLALQWLDYFWTDEGTLFYHMGIESETFAVDDKGNYDYLPFIYEEMKTDNKSFDDIVARYSPYPGGSNPTVETAPYFGGGEMEDIVAAAAQSLFAYGPSEYWPTFTFTKAENERLNALQSDINKYCSTSRIEFITGQRSFDKWNAYLQQLKQFGKDELLGIYRNAVDRHNKLLKRQ